MIGWTKNALRSAIAAPGVRHGLRWFLNQPVIPKRWRDLAHRKIAKRAKFGERPFSYTTPGGVPLRFLHGGTSNYLYWRNEYEPETTALFSLIAKRSRVILDIGAADGLYAILAAAANPQARIFAFEPGAAAARVATRNVELNQPITKHVDLCAIALGGHDEEAILYLAGETGGTSSLNPAFRANRVEERVSVRRGDAFLAEGGIEHVDLIKIDTESTEPVVLGGLIETLRRDHPDIICEVLRDRTETQLEELLAPLGYRFFWVSADGLVRHDHLTGDATYRFLNYLFTVRSDQEIADLSNTL